jgi:predicted regulator of Ras-like GTPase activity (Roadblock/LC7/MglB family)
MGRPSLSPFGTIQVKSYLTKTVDTWPDGIDTTDIVQFNSAVERLMKTEHVVTVFVSSRAGLFAYGETPRMTDRSVYSAITSMMLGAAEQMATEMDEILDHVILDMSEKKLVVIGAGPKHLIGILTDGKADTVSVVKTARKILSESVG